MISDIILDRYLPMNYIDNVPLMRYILASTFVTPKLLSLFDLITLRSPNKKILRLTTDTRSACKDFRNHSYTAAPLDKTILKLAGALYAIYDDAITIRGPHSKIKAWKIANAIACRQIQGGPSCKIQVFDTIMPNLCKAEPSLDSIADKLIEYADDCQAWLNEQYIDSDDDEVTEIIIRLHLLAKMIREFHN